MLGELFFFFCPYSLIIKRKHNLFEGSKPGNEVVSLEDETNFFSAKFCLFVIREVERIPSIKKIGTSSGLIEESDNIHESRFPASRWSHDCNEFTISDS